ncbi:MAG TPA: porin [Chthoniobacteraceae bacterium]|nr:porin [Chthoniobacteraceae bacterium]
MNFHFRTIRRRFPLLLPFFLLASLPAVADTPPEKAPSLYDKIWSAATLYSNPDNPVLQEFSLSGKIQLQWAAGNSDHGSYGSRDLADDLRWGDIDVRRWRLGFTSQWFGVWHFQAHADLNARGGHPSDTDGEWERGIYRDLHDLYLTYAPTPAFRLSLGKNSAHALSHEYETSSSKIIVFERNLLAATLVASELTGVWAKGEIDAWHYTLGLYSGDERREFSRFDAGAVVQGSLGYDFKALPWLEKRVERALLKLQYQYSSSSENDGGPGIYNHAFSLNSDLQAGKWGLYTDFLGGTERHGHGGAYGVVLTPSLFLTNKLQAVLRYQYAHGDHDSLQLQRRYERLAHDLGTAGSGSDYNALYLGLNYYLYGHKLKLMGGAEYHRMSNRQHGTSFDGLTVLTGLRLYF